MKLYIDHITKPVQSRLSFFRLRPSLVRIMFLSALLALQACSDADDEDPEPQRVVLVDATPLFTRSASELKLFLSSSAIDLDPNVLQYDVQLFKVTYKTTYKDEEITASGLVFLPTTTDEVGMVSFQHGTISAQSEAPTALPLNNSTLILYSALSSAGFITVVPDFIGFGSSSDKFHPYYVEQTTADAVIDNLKAARELSAEHDVMFNERLFLAGYSQGGYATMAAHKKIEEDGLEDFDLIASFPSSGGYDVKAMQEYFFSQSTYNQPYYMAYVARSYQTYYDWDSQSLSDFFNEPYSTRIPDLFNGTNTAGTINAQLTESIVDLIQPDLLANIDTSPEYTYLVDAFEENSLTDWVPSNLMFMYHGDADTTVPYSNSVTTYNKLIANGASASVVTLTALPGADHGSGVVPYVETFINKLLELK
jgi:pimeloyl-ACP methyl ester carboxylesterase